MTQEEIYQRYMAAVQQVTGNGNWIDFGVVRLALRLAVQDAYGAGLETCSGMDDDLAAIVASQNGALQAALDQVDPLREERNTLLLQLAQLDADNADLTQRLSNLAGVQAESERRRQEIADLREQVSPDYQNSLASMSAEIARLTQQNVIAVDTFNSLTEVHSNGNGPADVPTWWDALDDETNDYRVSLDAGRRTFRQLDKRTRLTLVLAFIRHIGAGAMPTQQKFDAAKPTWMPGGTGLTVTFGCAWSELLTLTPFEVAP